MEMTCQVANLASERIAPYRWQKKAISGDRWFVVDRKYCAIITLNVKNNFISADCDTNLAALDTWIFYEFI